MIYLAIDKHPYFIAYAVFEYESKKLIRYGEIFFKEKNESDRVNEIWVKLDILIKTVKPAIIVTHLIDLKMVLKKDLEHIFQIKTILRKLCIDYNILYNEFRTYGWEKRITKLKKPSKTAKLEIAKEYSQDIESVYIANAIILCEGVVWNRLQIGRD